MRILCVPDLHVPFQHPRALEFLRDLRYRLRPEAVVILGDEIDAQAFSRFGADPDLPSAGDEVRAVARPLAALGRLFPRAYVCASNHAARPLKRAQRAGLCRALVRPVAEWPGYPPYWHCRRLWTLDGIRFEHGDFRATTPAALQRYALANGVSLVLGHEHTQASIHYFAFGRQVRFLMRCGCLLDPRSPAFEYARQNLAQPILGCGFIEDGVPRLIPL